MTDRLRQLTGLSAGLTFLLVLLGVYTAAAGAGLTCGARWPLCDGAVFGLFPADWLSFVEWFHRLVAMVAGLLILGTTVHAWRRGDAATRTRRALALAALVLPSQVLLGALTVTTYEWLVLTAHFVTAMVILSAVVLAALWIRERAATPDADRVRRVSLAAAALVPAFALFSPRLLFVYGARVQVAYYALGLAAYVALLSAAVRARGVLPRVRGASSTAAALLFGLLVAGRQVYGGTAELLALAGTGLVFVLAAAAVRFAYTDREMSRTPRSSTIDD